ncbi:MAG: PKD domain-containing protein [Nitrospirae bacterium]|nr:PKD domain-containing protein [Nitrospirota bacterium]
MKKKITLKYFFLSIFLIIGCLALAQSATAGPLIVRVQPSGEAFSNAYVITGEARTLFGNVEGGTPPYDYRWEISNGTDTGFVLVGDPRYISIDGVVFGSAGDQWARLTVSDADGNSSSATIGLKVIAAASDTLNRKKNSAIDRGLRYLYLQEGLSASGSSWPGSGYPIGSTGMALVALENHGHNLQSPDSDIYKKSVQQGIQYLLNSAYNVQLSDQACIGDPEANDGDTDNDDLGVIFSGGGPEMYTDPIAMLAIVNSSEEAFAKALTVNTTSGDVNGMNLWDVIVDAKDFLAFAQGDATPGSSGNSFTCSTGNTYVYIYTNGLSVTELDAYRWSFDTSVDACPGTLTVDWGDGTAPEIFAGIDWCYYPQTGVQYLTHDYASAGSYNVTVRHEGTELCTTQINLADVVQCDETMNYIKGWRYERNYGDSDNSVTQWPTLALQEARDRWHINVNPRVNEELNDWLLYSQNANGGFGYTGGADWDWLNFPKTSAGLIMLKYLGQTPADTRVGNALGYLDTAWSWTSTDGNLGNIYAMYGFYKGMKLLSLADLNGRTWEEIYTDYLVNSQYPWNNAWGDCCWMDESFATYTALAILAPAVAGLPPVADAGGPYPDVNAGQAVNLDGSGSYHQDPAKNLVKYEWDFDASNGLWWETKPAPDAGEGAVGITPTTSYPDVGQDNTYTVTLRVTDDSSPVQTDTDTATVTVASGQVAPVAVTNGPWAGLPNEVITFDGSASYDPNSCTTPGDPSCTGDSIVAYEWDLDGDGLFNEANGEDGMPVGGSIVTRSFPEPMSHSAVLRVSDTHNATGASSDALNVVSIAIVYGQQYDTCFRQKLSRFEERLGIRVKFKNLGNGTAENLVMTLMSTPTNLQILPGKNTVTLGNLAAGEEKASACSPAALSAEIELKFDRRIIPTGSWLWKADFDFNGKHYVVNNIPPLGP